MDKIDKSILRIAQSCLPIHKRPFLIIGQKIGLSEYDVINRLKHLKKQGIIRRIGGNFNSSSLGWTSTLCAASVPKEKIDIFVSAVNAFPGVTHNYRRRHFYNIWFTFIAESMEFIETSLVKLENETGVFNILNLPAKKTFKICVDFPV